MENKSKKFFNIIILMFVVFSVLLTNEVNADEIEKIEDLKIQSNVVYENWNKLIEEEKENYIEPICFSVPYEKNKNITSQNINMFFSELKATYSDKYMINNLKVKDQKSTMECWAFSTTSIIESNIQKRTNAKAPELSPRHIDYATSKTFLDGINPNHYNREVKTGGNSMIAMGYCTSGQGPVLEEDMPFKDEEEKIPLAEIQNKDVAVKVDDYVIFPTVLKEYDTSGNVSYTNGLIGNSKEYYTAEDIKNIRGMVKNHIIQNGAITAYTYSGEAAREYFNVDKVKNGSAEYAYYCNNSSVVADHAITIVGWDDNYSKENFASDHMPKKDGAYIVLNSYGEENYNNGYYYISYDDFLIEWSLCGIIKTSDVEYNNIYQHDYLGYSYIYNSTFSDLYIGNVFERKESNLKEKVTEVSFVTNKITDVKLYINNESDDLDKAELVEDLGYVSAGYHTYTLKNPIEIKGNKFCIALKYSSDLVAVPMEYNYKSNNNGSNFWDSAKSDFGQSYMSIDGARWYDMNLLFKSSNWCIKAFTEYEENKEIKVTNVSINSDENILMNINDEIRLSATVFPNNATNKEVVWETSDEKIVTVNNGIVKAISSGTATIIAKNIASGKSDSIQITVNETSSEIPVTKIIIQQTNNTIKVGEKLTLKATVEPTNATKKEVKWKSSDESIANVDSNGIVTAVGEGKVTITAYNANNIMDAILINVLTNGNVNQNDGANKNDDNQIENQNNNQTSNPINQQNNQQNSDYDIVIKVHDEVKVEQNDDETLSSRVIPYAGTGFGVVILIVIVLGKLIFVIKKNYNMRDVE